MSLHVAYLHLPRCLAAGTIVQEEARLRTGLGWGGWTQVLSRARRLDVAKVQDAHPAPLGAPSFALLPPIALCPELPRSSSLPCLVVLTTGF